MHDRKNVKGHSAFWIAEAFLLAASGIFAFAVIGYQTIALTLFFAAMVTALYELLVVYAARNAWLGKRLKVALTGLLTLGFVWLIIVEVPIVASAHTDREPEAPYLVVLGAGVNGTEPSLSLLNRLEAAKAYLDAYPETVAVVSGGQGTGEAITEAECMRLWLTENGISPVRIIKEEKSTSTYENLENSLKLIRENGGDPAGPVAIVSSEYHLYRAKYMARALGADALGVAARTTYPILMINYFIREAFAVTLLWIM